MPGAALALSAFSAACGRKIIWLEGGFGWTESSLRLTVQILDSFDASPASIGVKAVVGSQ